MAAHMDTVVLGPAPCTSCGAWVEWLGVGPWVAIESHEPHDCGPYLEARARWGVTAGELQVARWPADVPSFIGAATAPEPEWFGRLGTVIYVVVALAAVLFAALLAARHAAGQL